MFLAIMYQQRRRPSETTVDPAAIRGLSTTFLAAVGCLPRARDEHPQGSLHAVEGDTAPGRRLFPCTWETSEVLVALGLVSVSLRGARAPVGPEPTESPPMHGHWRPRLGWHVCRGRSVFGRVSTAARGPSNGYPGLLRY